MSEQVSDLINGIFVVPEDADDDWNPGYEPSADEPGDFDEHGEGGLQ